MKIRRNRFSPYKLALFAHDLLVVTEALGLGVAMTGFSYLLRGSLSPFGIAFIFSLMTTSFFLTYKLYNYHLIFAGKKHLARLVKSFCWRLLSIFIVLTFCWWSNIVEATLLMPAVFLTAMGLMLLSRFFRYQISNQTKAVGLGFLAIGILALIGGHEKPIIATYWLTIPISFFLTVGIVLVSRCFFVQVVFNSWMRRRFRRQVAVIGSNGEAKRIASHVIESKAPFWISGIIGEQQDGGLDMTVPPVGV